MSKKLFLNLTGGLGNQLYIVASGIALAKAFDLPVEFDINGFKRYKLYKLSVNNILPNLLLIVKFLKLGFNITDKARPLFLINEYQVGFNNELFKELKKDFWGDIYLRAIFKALHISLIYCPS